jgi:uncharacterized protein
VVGKSQAANDCVQQLQNGIDQVYQTALSGGVALACQAGCNHCCSAEVEAFPPEVLNIVRALKALPAGEYSALVGRMRAHVATPSAALSWRARPQCPLLVDGLCAVYADRPSACRKAHSLDVRACEAQAPTIPQSLQVAVGVAAITEGTMGAYAQLALDAQPREMVQAVLAAIDAEPEQ